MISILGAAAAFRGSTLSRQAGSLEQAGIQEITRGEQLHTGFTQTIDGDLRNLPAYDEALATANLLRAQADGESDATAAAALRRQALDEERLATASAALFQVQVPVPPTKPVAATAPGAAATPGSPATYDVARAMQILEGRSQEFEKLQPQPLLDAGRRKRLEAVELYGLVALFIVALVFLTLAEFTRPVVRRVFAGSGVATSAIAGVLWVIVERHIG